METEILVSVVVRLISALRMVFALSCGSMPYRRQGAGFQGWELFFRVSVVFPERVPLKILDFRQSVATMGELVIYCEQKQN